jgi:hypothetical protein
MPPLLSMYVPTRKQKMINSDSGIFSEIFVESPCTRNVVDTRTEDRPILSLTAGSTSLQLSTSTDS